MKLRHSLCEAETLHTPKVCLYLFFFHMLRHSGFCLAFDCQFDSDLIMVSCMSQERMLVLLLLMLYLWDMWLYALVIC